METKSIPYPFDSTCFYYAGIYSKSECEDFINRITNPLKIDTTKQNEDTLRIVERTSLRDESLAATLFERLASICPATWHVSNEDSHLGPFATGDWELDSIDHRIQIYRYEPGGIFKKHRDGPTYYSVNKRSFFTILIYLNDEFTGGHTTVFTDDQTQHYSVPYSLGGCFVMLQRNLHEGSRVETGIKYALRCDVVYRRTGGTPEEAVKMLPVTEQAKKWFQLASAVELSGYHNESIAYYQKAYKLDPNLEENV